MISFQIYLFCKNPIDHAKIYVNTFIKKKKIRMTHFLCHPFNAFAAFQRIAAVNLHTHLPLRRL